MRIAYLINQYPMVSHSFIRREIQALERQGIEILRVASRGWDGQVLSKEDETERDRTHYILREGPIAIVWSFVIVAVTRPVLMWHALGLAWKMSKRAERPLPFHFIYLAEACFIVRLLRSKNIQHLHAHFGTNSAEVAMLAHELGGPPWSMTVHGPEEFDKKHLIGLAEKVRRCSFAVAISSFGRSQLYRCVDHSYWPKIHVVHCGIEPAFYAGFRDIPEHSKRLICVGRLTEQKGQLLLVEAARQLVERGTDFELVLAGDGNMRKSIEDLIGRYKLQNKVSITGWVSSERVREEILASRALVLPSFAEGLPVVIMEAMFLGRPVISTFVAGIPELVEPGRHGWLIPAGDIEALTQAIQGCLDTSVAQLNEMGQAARVSVIQRHDVEIEASKLSALFNDTIGPDSARTKISNN